MIDLDPIYEVPRAHSRSGTLYSAHPTQQRGSALFARTDDTSPSHVDKSARQPASRTRFPVIPANGLKLSSPWQNYRQTYQLRFGIDFHVNCAQSELSPCNEVIARNFPDTFKAKFHLLQELQHPNLLEVVDAFFHDRIVHVFFQHVEVSLYEVALIGIDTNELAAILGQVYLHVSYLQSTANHKQLVKGLIYLHDQRFEHGSLTISNTLVSQEGIIKIGT
jgi:serine/threonine protein kinase